MIMIIGMVLMHLVMIMMVVVINILLLLNIVQKENNNSCPAIKIQLILIYNFMWCIKLN